MQIDRLRRMALFALVVRHGSFSAASRAQDVSTSVLSAAVSQLEEELRVRLLHRSTRSLSLPGAGIYAVTFRRSLLPRRVGAAIDALSAYLAALESPATGASRPLVLARRVSDGLLGRLRNLTYS